MTAALIVSTARTPLAKSWKGAFNMTHGATLGGHAVAAAMSRAGIDPSQVEDVIMGCANPEGATGLNIARQIALKAGCPVSVSGMTVNRFCSSGLQTIAMAAQRIVAGEGDTYVAGGVESISCVQQEMNLHMAQDPALAAQMPAIYWSMLQTAEQVATRYKIDRSLMDAYGAQSQQRAAAARAAGLFDAEIAPITVTAGIADKQRGLITRETTVTQDEGIREGTTLEAVAGIRPAMPGGVVAAGNASQFSDGAGACVVMHEDRVAQMGLKPLGRFLGFAVAGCEPDEMGIGPVYAVPKVLKRLGLTVADIDLWELNEAFAVQVLYCRDQLGIDNDILNVNGGSISIGHPYGMTGARCTGHALIEGKGVLNNRISEHVFTLLGMIGIPTHFIALQQPNWMLVKPVRIVPVEVVVRNIAFGSLCKQMPIEPGTALEPPLLDLYYKDDAFGDPLLSEARLERLGLVSPEELAAIQSLALRVNTALAELFSQVGLELVDFKIELGHTASGELVVADEISPDTCRLWDREVKDSQDRILDKDRFRQDLGGVVEAYGEVLKRVQGACPEPRIYR